MSEQKRIQFSQNWNNKLQCHYFTTVRLDASHYREGEDYTIVLNQQFFCRARVVRKCLLKWDQFSEHLSYTDAGLSLDAFRKMLGTMYRFKVLDVSRATFCLLILQRLDTKGHPGQASIFDSAA